MLDNQSTFHIFTTPHLLHNICLADDPVGVQSSGVTTHCDTEGTLKYFGDVFLFRDRLTNILSFVLVHNKYNVSYDYTVDIFMINIP